MDYEQFKATFAEDLKTNLQKQEIEVDVSEHYIEKLNDSYDALSVTPKGSSIGVNANLDEIFHAVERGRDYSEVLSGVTESLKGSFEHMPKLQVSDLTNYAEKLGGDYFIIPSSIHEVLLVKDTGEMNARDLAAMIREVNATEVAPEDVLTDHAYHYDSKEHIFESADKFEERQAEMEAVGPEEDRGSLIEQLNAKKEEAAKEAPEKAAKDAVRKSRGGEAL